MSTLRRTARFGGILYLIIIVFGIFAQILVLQRLFSYHDPLATAENIISREFLYRFGFTAHIIMLICALILMQIFYTLFRDINRSIARLMVLFNLISIGIESVSILFQYIPLLLLKGDHLSPLEPAQLKSLAYVAIPLFSAGYDLALLFFGVFCILTGYLIIKSLLVPHIFGYLMITGGIAYMVNSFTHFLVPHMTSYLYPYILIFPFAVEFSLCIWLIYKGIKGQKKVKGFRT